MFANLRKIAFHNISGGRKMATRSVTTGLNHQLSRNIQDSKGREATAAPVYELRTYSAYPREMAEFLAFTKETFHIRTRHSRLVAYWVTEIGGINEVVHMWAYDSLNHRATVREHLAQNDEWRDKYLSKAIHMLQKMDNMLLNLHPASPHPNFSKSAAIFELQLFQMKNDSSNWSQHLESLLEQSGKFANSSNTSLVGSWKSVIGPQNVCAIIWQHQSPNDMLSLKLCMDANEAYVAFTDQVSSSFTKMLKPFLTNLWS